MNEDFYIGYYDRVPPPVRHHVRRVVVGATIAFLALVGLIAFRQSPADPGEFGFGITSTFSGTLRELPLPILTTVSTSGVATNYLLVGSGKFGLPAFARGHDGARVQFKGSLIRKGQAVMVEMNDEKSFQIIAPKDEIQAASAMIPIGRVVLTGELVDTKCYFGVMRPAVGKVHRACAVRCLSGGVPPGLLVRDQSGADVVVMMSGLGAEKLALDPQWAARTITAEGNLEFHGEIPVLTTSSVILDNSR